ncbi:hypothetical protein T439DRAFT_364694 [Meredithblackwellia eburnea MCA 4105]
MTSSVDGPRAEKDFGFKHNPENNNSSCLACDQQWTDRYNHKRKTHYPRRSEYRDHVENNADCRPGTEPSNSGEDTWKVDPEFVDCLYGPRLPEFPTHEGWEARGPGRRRTDEGTIVPQHFYHPEEETMKRNLVYGLTSPLNQVVSSLAHCRYFQHPNRRFKIASSFFREERA